MKATELDYDIHTILQKMTVNSGAHLSLISDWRNVTKDRRLMSCPLQLTYAAVTYSYHHSSQSPNFSCHAAAEQHALKAHR